MKDRGTVHLLIGPVGAGKTTWAQHRAAQSAAVFFDLDAWMVRLFGPDPRPPEEVMAWYLERRERCHAVIYDTALSVVDTGVDVFLELGLVGRFERHSFYEQINTQALKLMVYLVDAPRAVRRARVSARNLNPGPMTQVVPPEFFERASDAWEPPDPQERQQWHIIDV